MDGLLRPPEIHQKSARSNIVTWADEAAQATIVELLLGRYPDHAILGEEGSAGNPDGPYTGSSTRSTAHRTTPAGCRRGVCRSRCWKVRLAAEPVVERCDSKPCLRQSIQRRRRPRCERSTETPSAADRPSPAVEIDDCRARPRGDGQIEIEQQRAESLHRRELDTVMHGDARVESRNRHAEIDGRPISHARPLSRLTTSSRSAWICEFEATMSVIPTPRLTGPPSKSVATPPASSNNNTAAATSHAYVASFSTNPSSLPAATYASANDGHRWLVYLGSASASARCAGSAAWMAAGSSFCRPVAIKALEMSLVSLGTHVVPPPRSTANISPRNGSG